MLEDNACTQAVVLFVDDEPSILSALRRLFRPHGYRVLLAESGPAALALLELEPVDLVMSDMRMPEMDGAQFLERVRQRWPEVVRILLTGYADISSTIAAINRGEIHRYISKPWDDQDILLALRDGLQHRRLRQENQALLQLTQQQNAELLALNSSLEGRVKARTQELEQVNDMLSKAYEQLQQNFQLSLNVFAGLLELRDGSLAGYSRQVALMARRLAKQLALGAQAEEDVFAAGLLHEVGKISFPDALLRKPVSAMNAEELARYRRHPLNAEAALLPLAQLQRVAKLVRQQHERLDGKGFPDGLAGKELPLTAQVLGLVADYYGLQAGRLAEQRYGPEAAAAAIRGGAGTRYEQAVVDAFEEVLSQLPVTQATDRMVGAAEIQTGMVLARDLLGPQGTLLLAAGFVFDSRVVRQIREFAQREGIKLSLYVKLDAAQQAPRPLPQTVQMGKG